MSIKEIVLDTETTGLDVKDGHRIVEIGCIEIENYVPTKRQFHCYLNPERKVSEQAFKVHGYSDEFLISQKKFKDIVDDFLLFIKDKKLVIHNSSFDISHLNNELALIGKKKITENQVIDTLKIARDKFPGSQISLDALCKRYKIDSSRRNKHNAILDCELLTKVYINLIDQKEPLLNFQLDDKNHADVEGDKLSYCKTIIKPNEDEIKLHKNFLKSSLRKNFFN
tara:strand:- start:561 stop:1235 length:675 start_codon:yes stop_codon:yes gene_type:complete